MGSLSDVTVDKLLVISLPILVGVVILLILRLKLNVLSMSDEEAQSLDINPSRLRFTIIIAPTLVTFYIMP